MAGGSITIVLNGVTLPYKKGVIIMGVLRQIAEYFYLKKRDPNAPHTKWMKYMHGINRISLFMFMVAIIIVILKLTVLKRR